MKFTEIEINNFLAIGEAKFSMDALGLVHIAGQNEDETSADSNGSGKSSVADAISWCLWGTTARGITGDDVVNTVTGKNCSVILTIEDESETYQIRRYRKAAKHKNQLHLFRLDGSFGWQDITKGTNSLTQRQVERLLGVSEEVFNAAVYFGQESIPDIPRMTDKQLKTLVEQAAGVDVLTNAYDIAKQRHRETSEKRAAAQINLDAVTQRHADGLAALTRMSDEKSTWDTDHKVKVDNLKLRTTNAVAAFKKAEGEIDVKGEGDVAQSIKDCEDKIASVNDERTRESLLADDLAVAEKNLSNATAGVTIAERHAKTQAVEVTRLKAEVDKVKNNDVGDCRACGRQYDPSHKDELIAHVETELEAASNNLRKSASDLATVKSKLGVAQQLRDKASEALTAYRSGMTDVSAEADRVKNLRREQMVFTNFRAEVDRLKVAAQNLGTEWKREASATNPFLKLIDEADAKLLELAKQLQQAVTLRDATLTEAQYAQAVVDVFAPAGVRAHRLDEATPFLNDRTAHYLGSLADGAIDAFWTTVTETKSKDRMVERFSVTVEKAGSAPTFNALSGGEKRKVRLACALALQDLVATRASKSIELWIGDEIDDALDDAGLERLMGVLEEKARDRGTVLVISHNDIGDYARRTMTVTKRAGKAEVAIK